MRMTVKRVVFLACAVSLTTQCVSAKDTSEADAQTHIHIPFINIDIDKGPGKVHVKAPFVRVDRDATDGAVDVKAPFVKVQKDNSATPAKVNAPFTRVGGGVNDVPPKTAVQKIDQQGAAAKVNGPRPAPPATAKLGTTKTGNGSKPAARRQIAGPSTQVQ